MSNIAANVQQVRYPIPDNQPPIWAQGLAGMVGGVGSYMQQNKNDAALQQANRMKLLPVLAQMNMLKPGGKVGDPNVIGGGKSGVPPFTMTNPATNYTQNLARLKGIEKGYQLEPGSAPPAYARSLAKAEVHDRLLRNPYFATWLDTDYNKAVNIRDNAVKLVEQEISGKKTPAPAATPKVKTGKSFSWKPAGGLTGNSQYRSLLKKIPNLTWEDFQEMTPETIKALEGSYGI